MERKTQPGKMSQDEDENQLDNAYYSHAMEVFGRSGWDDPAMDIYNELDPRKNPCQ